MVALPGQMASGGPPAAGAHALTAPALASVRLRDLVALAKPRITTLNVVAAGAGLALAPGAVSAPVAVLAIVGVTLLVASANALNMYLERDVDALMARTRGRPLPAGRLAPEVALGFGLALAVVAVPMLSLGASPLAGALGAAAHALYVGAYTPLKRRTSLALFVGAVPGALPPLIGWAAVAPLAPGAIALFALVAIWQVPHFLAIALHRRADYEAAGLKVLPATHGEPVTRRALAVALVAQLGASLVLPAAGLGGAPYLAGAAAAGGFMLGWGLAGLRSPAGPRWSRGLFVASLVYLPVVLGLLFA